MRKSRPRKTRKSLLQNPVVVVALITGVVGILTALIPLLQELIRRGPGSGELPIDAVSVSTLNPPSKTPSAVHAITVTQTEAVVIPSDTPVPTTEPISLTCLDEWVLVNTAELPIEPESREGCGISGIPNLGFSTDANNLLLTLYRSRDIGIFGFSTSIPENAVVHLKVKPDILYNAEFWVALAGSDNPESRSVIMAIDPGSAGQQKQPGSIRIYQDGMDSRIIKYDWLQLSGTTGSANSWPYTYDILFKVTGGKVAIWVNNFNLDLQVLNFPKYLFIGYRNKSSIGTVSMDVTVSDLQIGTGK